MRTPDRWQADLLEQLVTREQDVIVCCARQVGKTEAVAAAAYLTACMGGFVLVMSPSDEQSKEFIARVRKFSLELQLIECLEEPTKHELLLVGGGRVLGMPNNEATVRGRSAVSLLVVDEAARVPDNLFGAVAPMLAVSKGRTALLSTPFGQRGFFWREWIGEGGINWRRHSYTWRECPRLSPEFIESEKRKHGELWVRQEYDCEFISVDSSYFDVEAFRGLVDPELKALAW